MELRELVTAGLKLTNQLYALYIMYVFMNELMYSCNVMQCNVSVHVHVHVNAHAYVDGCVYTYACASVCACIYEHIYGCICVYAKLYACMYLYRYTNITQVIYE